MLINSLLGIFIKNEKDLAGLGKIDKWPLFVKGRNVNLWRKVFGGSVKGFVVNNFEELLQKTKKAITNHAPVIAQEIIEGKDTNHFKYCAYVDKNKKILAELCLRKIRQNPIHFGVGAVVESVDNPELIKLGRIFFDKINYTGIGSAEFKYDKKDGKLKLIELNPRYWQQNALGEACGVNFPLINYYDLVGEKQKPKLDFKKDIKWVNRYMDFASFIDYKKEGSLSFKEWRKSLKGIKIYSDFAWDDPIPMLYEFRFGLKIFRIPIFLWKKIF